MPPDDKPPLRIALVEDDEDVREMMTELLGWMGHEVRCAVDGESGIALVASWQPDVALVDIVLPDIDGYEMAARLRGRPELERMRLIALTGLASADDHERSKQAGFETHVTKPTDLDSLAQLLASPPER